MNRAGGFTTLVLVLTSGIPLSVAKLASRLCGFELPGCSMFTSSEVFSVDGELSAGFRNSRFHHRMLLLASVATRYDLSDNLPTQVP